MAYWSIGLLLLSIIFLAYRHRPKQQVPRLKVFLHEERSDVKGKKSTQVLLPQPQQSTMKDDGERTVQDEPSSNGASDGEATPRANAAVPASSVPTFSLIDDSTSNKDRPAMNGNIHGFRSSTINSAQNASHAATSGSQAKPVRAGAGSMLPPPKPASMKPPSSAATLRIPSTGPLPNRGPPVNSQQRVTGGLSPNGLVPTPNQRGKVLLAPGHSPMDWAALTRKGNLTGVDTFQRVTPSVLKSKTGRKGKPAWSSWQGKVYNITPYIAFHPGGETEIMKAAGRDGTKLFLEAHPWVNWENMLNSCLVGVLVPENYGMGETEASSLEDMD